jgi:O-acetyl-ADP-ribose deacetylase (regulator of RNase III)
MKIIYEVGDMLTTPNLYCAQGCNAQGAMGSGIAKTIRDLYPNVYQEYRTAHLTDGLTLGDLVVVAVPEAVYKGHTYPQRVMINAITQEFAGNDGVRYVSYDGIARAIENIVAFINDMEGKSPPWEEYPEVSFPLIGAGLARGDWFVIARLIETLSTNFQPRVYVQTQAELDAIMTLLKNS